jgi:hypothetical protein
MRRKDHPLYETWKSMRQRCSNPNHRFYKYYGGKGIVVEKAWDDFERFCADVGERPEGYTLDRLKNTNNYGPGKTQWATKQNQNRKRTCCRYIEVEGEKLALSEVAERAGVNPSTFRGRLNRGMSAEAAGMDSSQ